MLKTKGTDALNLFSKIVSAILDFFELGDLIVDFWKNPIGILIMITLNLPICMWIISILTVLNFKIN